MPESSQPTPEIKKIGDLIDYISITKKHWPLRPFVNEFLRGWLSGRAKTYPISYLYSDKVRLEMNRDAGHSRYNAVRSIGRLLRELGHPIKWDENFLPLESPQTLPAHVLVAGHPQTSAMGGVTADSPPLETIADLTVALKKSSDRQLRDFGTAIFGRFGAPTPIIDFYGSSGRNELKKIRGFRESALIKLEQFLIDHGHDPNWSENLPTGTQKGASEVMNPDTPTGLFFANLISQAKEPDVQKELHRLSLFMRDHLRAGNIAGQPYGIINQILRDRRASADCMKLFNDGIEQVHKAMIKSGRGGPG